MKECVDCEYAKWKKTKAGRLHPSGEGLCKYPYKIKPLPMSMFWFGKEPSPSGGFINRHKQLKDHCVYYSRHIHEVN